MKEEMMNIKAERLQAPRRSNSPRAAPSRASPSGCTIAPPTSTSTAASRATGWTPRLIHFKGWSPFGAGDRSKISRAEALRVQEAISSKMPDEARQRTRWLTPFLSNHRISAEIWMCKDTDCKCYSDMVSMSLQTDPIYVPGKAATC